MSRPSVVLVLLAVALPAVLAAPAGGASETTQERPDLRVVGLQVAPASPDADVAGDGRRLVSFTIVNSGRASAPSAVVHFAEIELDGFRRVLATMSTPTLPPSASVSFTVAWTPRAGWIGDVDLVVSVDPHGLIEESDEWNNAQHARGSARAPPGLVFPPRVATSPAAGPVLLGGEWSLHAFDQHDFHNPARGLLLDRAGRGRDALMPEVPLPAAGIIGAAARFDGASHYRASWPPVAGPVPEAGVAFWVKVDQRPRFGQFAWSVPAGECHRQGVEVRPEGTLRLWAASKAGGCVNVLDSAKRLDPGRWSHVAVSWTGTTATLYVNGELQGVRTAASPPAPAHGWLLIGALNLNDLEGTVTAHLSDAVLDDFRVFERALLPGDVAALYALGRRLDAASPAAPGLVGGVADNA